MKNTHTHTLSFSLSTVYKQADEQNNYPQVSFNLDAAKKATLICILIGHKDSSFPVVKTDALKLTSKKLSTHYTGSCTKRGVKVQVQTERANYTGT